MKGTGNSMGTLLQKLYFAILPTSDQRSRYIADHADMFRHVGKNVRFQPRKFPSDPEYISIGDNVNIASDVLFVTHDQSMRFLNCKFQTMDFEKYCGCIEIGDNVMIGSRVCICPDVRIGNNCVIGAGSVVTKDIPDNSVAAGVPCRVIGSFDAFTEKRRNCKKKTDAELWLEFYEKRKRE